MGYGSVYEKEIHLSFENGVLLKRRELDNRKWHESEKKAENRIYNPSSKKSYLRNYLVFGFRIRSQVTNFIESNYPPFHRFERYLS